MAAPNVNDDNKQNDDNNANDKLAQFSAKPPAWNLMCDESKQVLADENVVCQIRRSKNDNRVIYRAILNDDGTLNSAKPLEVFWLKIEKSYIEKNRKSNKMDDKTLLTFLENNIAYGVTVTELPDNKGQFKVVFVALKSRPCILKIDPKDKKPKCFGTIKDDNGNDIECILKEMYVATKENWVGLPTVQYVLVKGIRYDNGEYIEDKVTK